METKVIEMAPDVYRNSTFHPEFGIQFNQVLIKDDEPFIITSPYQIGLAENSFRATGIGINWPS